MAASGQQMKGRRRWTLFTKWGRAAVPWFSPRLSARSSTRHWRPAVCDSRISRRRVSSGFTTNQQHKRVKVENGRSWPFAFVRENTRNALAVSRRVRFGGQWHWEGQGFDSPYLHQFEKRVLPNEIKGVTRFLLFSAGVRKVNAEQTGTRRQYP